MDSFNRWEQGSSLSESDRVDAQLKMEQIETDVMRKHNCLFKNLIILQSVKFVCFSFFYPLRIVKLFSF